MATYMFRGQHGFFKARDTVHKEGLVSVRVSCWLEKDCSSERRIQLRKHFPNMCTYTLPVTYTSINLLGPAIPTPPSALRTEVHFLAVSIATFVISET